MHVYRYDCDNTSNTLDLYELIVYISQLLMNAVPAMEAVHRYVPTHQDYDSVAVGLDTEQL